MKKAQVEVFGIAISIALIIFVVLIFIGLQGKSKTNTITKEVTYNKLAWDFVNALIKTSTPCSGVSLQNLLVDAAASNSITCKENSAGVISTVSSGEYSRDAIKEILDSSLGARGEEYNLSVSYSKAEMFSIASDKIESCKNINYAAVPISTGYGKNIEVSIKICVD